MTTVAKERIQAFFDERSADYAQSRAKDSAFQDLQSVVLSLLPPQPSRILDLGCGVGTVAESLAQQGHTVTGVDLSAGMIEAAQKARQRLEPAVQARLTYQQGSFETLPQESFEAIVCLGVLEYVEELPGFLAQTKNLSTPAGMAIFALPNREALGERFNQFAFRINRLLGRTPPLRLKRTPLAARTLHHFLRTAGYEIEKTTYAYFFVYPFDRLWPGASRRFHLKMLKVRERAWAELLGGVLVVKARRVE